MLTSCNSCSFFYEEVGHWTVLWPKGSFLEGGGGADNQILKLNGWILNDPTHFQIPGLRFPCIEWFCAKTKKKRKNPEKHSLRV